MNDHITELPATFKLETPLDRTIETLRQIAREHGCTVDDLTGPSRADRIYRARVVAYRVLYSQGRTKCAVGKILGGRDHSTVAHGLLR